MSRVAEVVVLVEGRTEQRFVKQLLTPYMADRGVYLSPIILDKPGEKGGDVKYARARNDIEKHLKQRRDTWITLLIDYYGIGSDWPGKHAVQSGASPSDIATAICTATQVAIDADFPNYRSDMRFVPHIAVHEFEALLFSEPAILAKSLQVDRRSIDDIIRVCGEPEAIDDSPQTAPSKRIEQLYSRFKKTIDGIAIAQDIGIDRMRTKCPVFDAWLTRLELLAMND
jgi:hypothetical protein